MSLLLASRPAVSIVMANSCGLVVNARRDLPLSVKDDSKKIDNFQVLIGVWGVAHA